MAEARPIRSNLATGRFVKTGTMGWGATSAVLATLRVILVVGIRRRLDRSGQHRNGLILLWDIHRLVVRVVRDLLDRGFVDQGVFRNHARLGIRDVESER